MSSEKHLESVVDCETLSSLIPDYAFGLTDAEESRLVESGLPFCPDATAQLAEFRQMQDDMRASVAEFEPPPMLGERLMAAIALPAPALSAPAVVVPPTPKPASRPASRFPKINPAWAAAAAALVVLVITNFYWFGRVNELNARYVELDSQVNNGDEHPAFVLSSTSNLRWVRLPPAEESTKSAAFLMWNMDSEIGVLYASNFPELATGKIYQLWLTRGDERISAGTFRVDSDGKGALLFHITGPIDNYTWARVTAEPETGSQQPGDKVITVGEL